MTSDARFVMRVRCQPAKKNVLFRLIGPPANPPYWLRLRKSFSAEKKPLELNLRSLRYSNAPPCKLFVPERVTTFTTAPALLP